MSISLCLRIVLPMSVLWVLAASPATAQPEGEPSPGSPIPVRVAILPFDNIGGVPGDDWIGAGLVETVTTDLESLRNTTVISQDRVGAIFDRRGNEQLDDTAVASLGRELRARWVMAGSYQRQGDELRITARLVDAANGLLADTVTASGTLDDLFDLQDRIAQELTAGVRPGPVAQATPPVPSRRPGLRTPRDGSSASAAAGLAGGSAGLSDADRPSPLTVGGTLDFEPSAAAAGSGASALSRDDNPSVSAALPPAERYRIEPTRVETPPQLDGNLGDEAWLGAAIIDEFIQQEPTEGDPATERTVVRLIYDATALYIGVEAYDRQPDGVIATEKRRDSRRLLDEDNFQIIIDTFQDRRSGYMFVTSPLGAKLEQQVAAEGEGGFGGNSSNINVNWDGVWDVATSRTADGWIAEIAIPMVTLRFPEAERQVWGVNFMRNIRRKNEQVFWAPIPKAYSLTRVSLAGTMAGVGEVDRGMDLRVTPYVLAGGRQDRVTTSALSDSGFNEVGLDVKYGVSSGLNLDVTLNTDFAQVEVDEQQVNLTRFALFFPEKRDFFLENSGMFGIGTQGFRRTADLFFTRRIGLSAAGQPVPIIGGGRLTGKVDRHNIAVMNIQTQSGLGQLGENFFVGRYSRDILARSRVGGLVVNKEAIGGNSYNRTFAVDTTLAPHRNFVINSFLAKTETPDVSTGDMAGYVSAAWLSPSYRVEAEYTDIQDNFNAEVGFVPRTGIRISKLHGEWDPRPGRWGIRQFDPMWNVTYTTDQNNRLLTRRIHNMLGTYFADGSSFIAWYNDHFEQLDFAFPITSGVTIPPGTYRFGEWSFRYRSDASKRIFTQASYSPQTFFGGDRTDSSVSLGVRLTDSVAAEGRFSRSDVVLPGGAFVADLASMTFDLALSPEMTLRSLTQYNSTTDSISTSVRFNWIYSPGSDIYIAYDELRADDFLVFDPSLQNPGRVPWIQNRQLAVKMTYLLSR
jgi:TolB-like protein